MLILWKPEKGSSIFCIPFLHPKNININSEDTKIITLFEQHLAHPYSLFHDFTINLQWGYKGLILKIYKYYAKYKISSTLDI